MSKFRNFILSATFAGAVTCTALAYGHNSIPVIYAEKTVEPENVEESAPDMIHLDYDDPQYLNEPIEMVFSEIDDVQPTEETEPEIDANDIELLACVIYQEAGSDYISDDCRRYVADVVLNRVNDPRFPNTIRDVLMQEGQYGRYHWTGVIWPGRAQYENEAHAVARAYRIAEEVLRGNHSKLYGAGYIWQAGFIQGYDVIECCGTYFGK